MRPELALAIEYRTAQRFDEARALFTKLYQAQPDDPAVNYHFAWLLDNRGEERAAIPFYERAIELGLRKMICATR